jgi:hypothetical protein
MSKSRNQESLRKFSQVIESFDLEKRIAATKWLEGVIVAQNLTAEERESIVKASNEYIDECSDAEYVNGVNALIEYLRHVQKKASRELKRAHDKGEAPNLTTIA